MNTERIIILALNNYDVQAKNTLEFPDPSKRFSHNTMILLIILSFFREPLVSSLHGLRSDPFEARRWGILAPFRLRRTFPFLLALDPPEADCSSKFRSEIQEFPKNSENFSPVGWALPTVFVVLHSPPTSIVISAGVAPQTDE
jgi:hypothetical protein